MRTTLITCNICRQPKPLSRYYKHPRGKCGVSGPCKICFKARARANRLKRVEHWRAHDRERGSRQSSEYTRQWRKNNPEKWKAICAVNNAIRNGKLIKRPCEVCDDPESKGHHDDYNKPLKVRWLCQAHHSEHHAIS